MPYFGSKRRALLDFFRTHPKAALAFSGGTDSAYLLYAALKNGADIQPYFIKSPFQPQFELEDAQRLCALCGIGLKIVEADTLSDALIAENTDKRCYHCKKLLFSLLKKRAGEDGYTLVIDGTNASDLASDRPGIKALEELGIVSPLRECGITKADVRVLSKKAHLFTWNKSSYACLATRIPCGTPIREEKLRLMEKSESKLARLGFSDFRIRLDGNTARIEVRESQMKKVVRERETIRSLLADDFSAVVLDLKGR
ncbi:ATP-dependent sacrificial sulfur transferase LarE [Treponema sp. OMZ 840]|uniref:ATP-dependent sacrificial sulfur transferase LarE n=1 Tax=Treponema sp. OMZ 840 TaxID=244313 RepID=UPI003D8DCE95